MRFYVNYEPADKNSFTDCEWWDIGNTTYGDALNEVTKLEASEIEYGVSYSVEVEAESVISAFIRGHDLIKTYISSNL